MELFDFVGCKRNRAGAWFKALVEQGIDGDPKAVLFAVFALSWGEFGHDNETRYASGIFARRYYWSALDEVSDDFAVAGLPCQLKALTEGSARLPFLYSSRSSYS